MKAALLIITLIFSSFYSNAQKIKYKDLFVLLRAKNYKDASSFLRNYVIANPEHPNANYQMGLMLEFKIKELDLLKESDAIVARADSAIMYFDKAYAYITPKEVKKHNDDYYEFFKRRNLRSGKFEVILSDVQLDIENRKAQLAENKKNVEEIKVFFNNGIRQYDFACTLYDSLKFSFKNELILSLGATDTTVSLITEMIILYDSSFVNFKKYKSLKKEFESTTNDVIIDIKPILDFSDGASSIPNYFGSKISLSDFKTWGLKQQELINERKQFIIDVINYDASLDELSSKLISDSVALSSEILKKITASEIKTLREIDSESWLLHLFDYKISQLSFSSLWMDWHNQYADSLDVGGQLNYLSKIAKQFEDINVLEKNLKEIDLSLFAQKYHQFIKERFGNDDGVLDFINAQKSLLATEKQRVIKLDSILHERDKWGYLSNDTIPLFITNDSLATNRTFYVDSLEDRLIRVLGLKVGEQNQLYFTSIPSSRNVDSLFYFETDLSSLALNSANFIFEIENPTVESYVILIGILKEEECNLDLARLTVNGGFEWQMSITVAGGELPNIKVENHQVFVRQNDTITKYQLSDGLLIEN